MNQDNYTIKKQSHTDISNNPDNFTEYGIKKNEPLKDKNWFNTGGSAQYYCEPKSIEEFQQALFFSQKNSLPIFILGEGANILVHDNGFKGLVIRPAIKDISFTDLDKESTLVTAGAGVCFEELIKVCLSNQILGLEEFSGIPGTVGGSVFINIHYFRFLLSHFLVKARVIEKSTGNILDVDNTWFNFGYNTSTLHQKKYYLVDATFKLTKADKYKTAYAQGRHEEIIRHRKQRYPYKSTCGSFFRNFHNDEVTLIRNNRKLIFVAYYLDKVGIKGELSHGNAIVSHQHANMIVNQGNATTSDIVNLALNMQKKVYDKFSLKPQPECQLIGFDHCPFSIL